MNRIVLVGRLIKDPELKVFEESGKSMTRFIIAVDRTFKNASGERMVDFIPIIAWGKKAEIICEYMTKGKIISICGRLKTGSYLDEHGNKKYTAEVVVDEFQFIGNKSKNQNQSQEDAV